MTASGDWKARTEAYKASILESIPKEWRLSDEQLAKLGPDVRHVAEETGILTPAEVKILAQDATSLAKNIAAKKYTAVEVATAYCKSAAVAHQTTNCLMDYFADEALERAKWLDEQLEKTGKPVGPLHGVPISVKDMLAVEGRRMSAGYLAILESDTTPKKDSVIVAAFRKAGAVFHCKTSNPQAIMHLETDSFLGPTTNPFNTKLTPGGSSGGESALIGAGGSVLGIGTDIGGSIRNPCANVGLYGFKPTSIRLPRGGNLSGMPNQEAIVGAIGPMGVSARDCELFVTTVLDTKPWLVDSQQAKMPWRADEVEWIGGDKPKIGVMWDDGVVKLQPPMQRALQIAVDKLKAAGYDVVDYKPYKTAEAWEILKKLYWTDGGDRVKRLTEATGEPILPLTQWILGKPEVQAGTVLFDLIGEREKYRTEYAKYWNDQNVDIVLSAPYPGPAPALGTSKWWMYTALWNLLDYPGAVFPTGESVQPTDVKIKREYLSEDDKLIDDFYDPELMANAPLCLQLQGFRWEDEKVVEALKMVSKVVNP